MMRKPVLTIFYQFNPWNTTIGGIQTLIKLFIKYAPSEFEIRLVGTGDQSSQSLGRWQEADFVGRTIKFFPLFKLENDNIRGFIPTTVKYTAALFGRNFASDFMHFHRLEPTIAVRHWQGEKTLFIHNDIHAQIKDAGDKNAILWRRFPGVYFQLESLLIGQFQQILSCNTDSAQFYKQHYPKLSSRIAYIKNSFDSEVFYPWQLQERAVKKREFSQKLGLADETQFVLFAGRLHPQKDPVLLVQAISVLNQCNVHLLIVGDGELASQVRQKIEECRLSNQITMLGVLKQEELADLHRISDVFVLSSAYEGLPLVVLEALACGTPVVTTRTGETPNILTANTGVVCDARTPESIAAGLRQILNKPDNYSVSACIRVANPYAARTVVSEVYKDMFYRWEQRNNPKILQLQNIQDD